MESLTSTSLQQRHPEMFRPMIRESPRGKKRTVPMECLCLGFMRTGTASMCAAMEILGIRCWHSLLFLSTNLGDVEMWEEAADRKFFGKGPKFGKEEFDQLLHDFGGVSSDTPAIAFADDLIEAYPDAKVVLVERDIDSWYKSFNNTIVNNMNRFSPIVWLVYYLDPFIVRPIGRAQHRCVQGWMGAYSAKTMRQNAKPKYKEHYELIRSITPKERLLEFKLSDGWEPLCDFLDKPIPDQSFPHLNEQAWLDEKINLLLVRGMKAVARVLLLYFVPVIFAIGLGYFYWNQQKDA